MTWNHEGPTGDEDTHTLVTVNLRRTSPDGTELTVTEEPVQAAAWEDAEPAWNGALDALEALLTGPSGDA
jgi:hypothetical protein